MNPFSRIPAPLRALALAMLLPAALASAAPSPADSCLPAPFAPHSSHAPIPARADGNAMDPFLAGALGIVPFVSGLYVSERPARGILFTSIDVLAALGIYTARYTAAGDPNNARNYFFILGANNLIDAWLSSRYALAAPGSARAPRALVLPLPRGGIEGALHWKF